MKRIIVSFLIFAVVLFISACSGSGGGETIDPMETIKPSPSDYNETIVQNGGYGNTGEYAVETYKNAEIAQEQANTDNIPNVIEQSDNLLTLDITSFPEGWNVGEIILVRMPDGTVEYKRLVLKFKLSNGQLAIGVENSSALEAVSSMELTTEGTVSKLGKIYSRTTKSVDYEYSESQEISIINKNDLNIFQVKDGHTEVTIGFPEIKLAVNPTLEMKIEIDKPIGLSDLLGKAIDFAESVYASTDEALDVLGINDLVNDAGDEILDVDGDKALEILDLVRGAEDVAEALESIQSVLLDKSRLKFALISMSGDIYGSLKFSAISKSEYTITKEASLGTVLVPITGPVPLFLEFEIVADASFTFNSELNISTGASVNMPVYIKAKIVDGEMQPLETSQLSPEINLDLPSFDGTKAGFELSAGIQVESGVNLAGILAATVDPKVSMVFETTAEVEGDLSSGCIDLGWDLYCTVSAELEAELDIVIDTWEKNIEIFSKDFLKDDDPYGLYEYCWGVYYDTDGDGILDDIDACPGTPEGASVDENGCSESQLDTDSDGDGIADDLDSCPDTPNGEIVDGNGCSDSQIIQDSDSDGVSDDIDSCPATPLGESVDGNGCSEAQISDYALFDDFEDGDSTSNPAWSIVNNNGSSVVVADPDDAEGHSLRIVGTATGHRLLSTNLSSTVSWNGFFFSIDFYATNTNYYHPWISLINDEGYAVRAHFHRDNAISSSVRMYLYEGAYINDENYILVTPPSEVNQWWRLNVWHDTYTNKIRFNVIERDSGNLIGEYSIDPTSDLESIQGISNIILAVEETSSQYIDNVRLFNTNGSNTVSDGLVAYYPFNGNAYDESGNGYNGVVNDATLIFGKDGGVNQAFYFNGENSYINIPYNSAFYPQSITASAWVRYDATPLERNYILTTSSDVIDPPYDPFRLYIDDTGYINVHFSSSNDVQSTLLKSSIQLNQDEWYFIVTTFDANSQIANLYVNSELDVSETTDIPFLGFSTRGLSIGGGQARNSSFHQFFSGSIDEVSIYSRALNIIEIIKLYTK